MKVGNIKFKAKSIYNNEWVYGDLLHKTDGTHIYMGKGESGHILCPRVDPSTVCLFTGLKDLCAEEVWEGDIIENPEFPFEKRTVTWFDCVLGFVPMDEDECQDRDVSFLVLFKKWKVVGNKFDRKEGEK